MLSVFLTILKIVGIVLLVVLLIAVTLLCMVLFVPVRYRAQGFYQDSYAVKGKVSWLLHIITVTAVISEQEAFQLIIRLFGIPVYNKQKREQKAAAASARSKKKEHKKKKMRDGQESDEHSGEIIASSIDTSDTSSIDINTNTIDTTAETVQEQRLAIEKHIGPEDSASPEKQTVIQKIRRFILRIVNIIQNIHYTFSKIYDTIISIKSNINYYIDLCQQDYTKAAFVACKKQLFKIWNDLKPRQYKVNITIGTGDPASLGEILSIWGMLYPIHQGNIMLYPDFDQEIFFGDFSCKGRISVYVYITAVLTFLFDKNIKRFRKCLFREEV